MINLLIWVGRLAGLLGLVLVTVAVAARAMGLWRIAEMQVGTLLQGAIAAMVLGALAYTAAAAEREPR